MLIAYPIHIIHAAVMVLMLFAAWPVAAFDIQKVTSPSGLTAWLIEDHRNPVIAMEMIFKTGAADDPESKQGLANLLASTLDEGAGELGSTAFQSALSEQSISLRFKAGADRFSGALQTLTDKSAAAFELLRLALQRPRFDDDAVNRMRAQVMAKIRADQQNPQGRAWRTWMKSAFPDHPYGRPRNGNLQSVGAITGDDLARVTTAGLSREGLSIGVVGDITAAQLATVLDQVFADLPANRALPVVSDQAPLTTGKIKLLSQDIPQSIIVFGHAGIPWGDPDYFGAMILMQIMSGGFESRLMQEVRVKRGLAYGISANLLPRPHSPLVVGSTATRNDKAGETVNIIRTEWRKMADQGPSAAEIADAKSYLVGAFPLRFTSSPAIARSLASFQNLGLPIDYPDKRAALINNVTAADLKRIAQRLFRDRDLSFTILGKPSGLSESDVLQTPAQ